MTRIMKILLLILLPILTGLAGGMVGAIMVRHQDDDVISNSYRMGRERGYKEGIDFQRHILWEGGNDCFDSIKDCKNGAPPESVNGK